MFRFIGFLLPAAWSLFLLSSSAAAFEGTLIIEGRQVSIGEPWSGDDALRGERVWLGDGTGERGIADVGAHGLLEVDKGQGPFLAYGEKATFQRIEAQIITDPKIKKTVADALQKLGVSTDAHIDASLVALLDLDFKGRNETIIQAHSARDPANPYLAKPGDIEALLVLSAEGQMIDSIVVSADANQNGGARTIVEVVALGRRGTQEWNLLVRQTSRFVGQSPISFSLKVNGEQITQPANSSEPSRVTRSSLAVYRYLDDELVRSDQLVTSTINSCIISSCKD